MTNDLREIEDVMTVWQWIGVIIVLGLPIINVIMYFIWAISPNTNRNLRNFCKATILLGFMLLGLGFIAVGCSVLFQ